MNIKLLLLLLLSCGKCSFKSVTRRISDAHQTDSSPSDGCKTRNGNNGYCVAVRDCKGYENISKEMVENSTYTWRCGPRNERRKNPKICCEKHDVFVPTTVSPKEDNKSMPTCGFQNIDIGSRIYGGETTVVGEFPWMARLLHKNALDDVRFTCTGVLISPKVVLTTAHCLVSRNLDVFGNLYAVTLGEYETECGFGNNNCLKHKKIALVSKIIVHSDYNTEAKNHEHDIGLIILDEEVELSEYIVPICLLEERRVTGQYFISGWGKTESGGNSRIKLKAALPSFSWQQCVDKYRAINVNLTENHICAGGVKGQDSCQGDSGGPLMLRTTAEKWFVAGLVSFGVSCGSEGWPGVYTNVPKYVQWIKRILEENK